MAMPHFLRIKAIFTQRTPWLNPSANMWTKWHWDMFEFLSHFHQLQSETGQAV